MLDSAVRRSLLNMSMEKCSGNQRPGGCEIVEREKPSLSEV